MTVSTRGSIGTVGTLASWGASCVIWCSASVSARPQPPTAVADRAPTAESSRAGGPSVGADYVRSVDSADHGHVKLETSVRTLRREGMPDVVLVGVVHVGETSYYRGLQALLDAQGLVLYEGVKPPGSNAAAEAGEPDTAKAERTRNRLRLAAIAAERFRQNNGRYAATWDELLGAPRSISRLAQAGRRDAWGHEIEYRVTKGENADANGAASVGVMDLISPGSDGRAGGEGSAADLAYSAQKKLTRAEIGGKDEGIQTKLADALGLEFQLSAIDYQRANWRNSDLSIDEVQAKLKESGASGEALFRMLDGSSASAKIAGLLLGLIESSRSMQSMGKLMMVEMLSRADELMAAGGGMGPGGGKLMKVILHDRNAAVLDDLRRALKDESRVKSVALFYGAGHLPELERVVTDEMGYTLAGEQWFAAIDMDLKQAGISPAQASQLRETIRKSIESQMGKKREVKKDSEDAPAGK